MRFSALSRNFRRDERGAVAMMFGLSLVPLAGMVGVAVDYSRASLFRSDLQIAADATSLALAKSGLTMTPAQADAFGRATFMANWRARDGASLDPITITRTTDRYVVTARAVVNNSVMQVLGAPTTPVAVRSETGWGVRRMEIALVLDNTGSMGWSNKMQELKRALCGDETCSSSTPTAGFIKAMRDASIEDGQIRIALVPFDTTVRVPLSEQNTIRSGTATATTFSFSGAGYCGANTTVANRISFVRFANRDKDTTASSGGCGSGRAVQATWNGCMWDRDQDANRDTTPVITDLSDVRNLYPAVNCRSNNLQRMQNLLDVRTNTPALITALAGMQPSGNTNLTIGVNWGNAMLTPGAPLSNAATPASDLIKYMILLTDGDNTENRQTGNQAAIDARAQLACTDAKNRGYIIYAIRVIEGNRTLLQNCATSINHYKEVSSASQLNGVFQEIAGQIGGVRLTH